MDVEAIIKSIKKTGKLLVVESGFPAFGVASEIMALACEYAFDYLDAPIRRITSADAPLHYAPNLAALALPDVARTVKLVKEVMYLNK